MIEAPTTEEEWRQALIACHPDGPTPDEELFKELNAAREAWLAARPRLCQWCGVKPIPRRPTDRIRGGPGKYCGGACAAKGRGALLRSRHQRKLKAPRAVRPPKPPKPPGVGGGHCVYCRRRAGTELCLVGWCHRGCVAAYTTVQRAKARRGA